ncbi:MAG: hypothetical protein FWD30_03110 [Dehalococcoidia bacterium]|nr:hypothetical protein [Dehalococcoidia bacterium]
MNKKVLILFAVLLATMAFIAGCAVRTGFKPGAGAKPSPHPSDLRYSNCLSCHAGDLVVLPNHDPLEDFTNETCTIKGCHAKP